MKILSGVIVCGVLIILGLGVGLLQSEDAGTPPKDQPDASKNVLQTRNAIEKGLKFLSGKRSKTGAIGNGYPIAITSLAGLAFLGNGNLPGSSAYSADINAIRRYLVKSALKSGYICEGANGGNSRMHGHGFATWFLAEYYGATRQGTAEVDDEIKIILKRAVKVIEDSQSNEGGWYYEPQKGGDEGSVTVCIVQALRAARNVGIAVNKTVIDRGIDYLKRSENPDGSFKYSLTSGGDRGTFTLAAGGVSSFVLYGLHDAPETKKGMEFLLKFKPGTPQNWSEGYPYYANFYAALAMHLAGEKYWNDWYPPLVEDLLKKQQSDGSWSGSSEPGPEYCTAFACLMLEIPLQYLPLFHK